MNSNPAALIACESVLDPILEQLTAVLDEHSANFAGPVAEALQRLRSTAADTSLTISAATSRRSGQYHPSTAGLSSYIAATVTPTDVSPCETRAVGKNRAPPRPGAGDRQGDVPVRP